jgi:hypothetical protein
LNRVFLSVFAKLFGAKKKKRKDFDKNRKEIDIIIIINTIKIMPNFITLHSAPKVIIFVCIYWT